MTDRWQSPDGRVELRCGRYQDALADVGRVDAVICDPPYSERTHAKQVYGHPRDASYCCDASTARLTSRGLGCAHWTPRDVREFVDAWVPRCTGWFCALTSHDLAPHWEKRLAKHGRYVFAPLACVQHAMNVRRSGDGHSNWTVWLVAARPRTPAFAKWGTLRGAYVGPSNDTGRNALDRSTRAVAGGKPDWLMRQIVADHSRPGDLICDPCAGGGTTLLAAALEGRRAIGSEMDPKTYTKAVDRLRGWGPMADQTQPNLLAGLAR